MPGSVSDEAFARGVQQMGVVSYEQLEAAKAAQAQSAAKGVLVSLADMLVQQGVITAATRENIEKKLQAQQAGGIQKLGNYKLIKKLGEGGMGAVYLAEDTLMNRKVALKILPKKHAGDSEFLSRFRREAQATAQLNHANIVNAYTVGEELGHHFIVMEYCEGESLEALLKREHFVQWDLATGLVLQVARGLQHAHERGIIHRDIKPANIMLCNPVAQPSGLRRNPEDCATFAEGFVVKILDLGLSKNVGAGEQSFNTQTGVALGTPHYISPEQANGDKNIDGRTDIYSLGATFYHLVTGETPFQASTAMAIMMKHINEQLPNPQDIRDEIPDGVVQVIQRMMAKAPADRYRDCKELLDDLELVIDGKMPSSQAIDVGKSSVAVAKVPRASRPPGAPASRRPLARAGAGARPPVLTPLADARGSESPGAARQSVGRVANPPHPPGDLANRPTTKYIAIGALGVGALILVLALFFGGGGDKPGNQAASTASTPSIPSISSTPSIADTEAAAKLKAEAARLEEKRKADEAKLEEEKRKLAEGLRKLEEARLAAEAEAKKKAEAPATKVTPPPVQPDTKTTQPDTKASETPALPNAAETRAAKAQQLFSTVLKETGPLLIQNKLSDAIALLERKAKDPVLADAAELVKQEKSDVESVLALRQAAIEALRLPLGKQIALKKGGTLFKGKVVNEPKADAVTFDMGDRAQMTFTSTMLSLEDVDQYAPRTGNVGADLRQRGIMYLAAGNVAMAKEYFSKPQTLNPEPYLDRITQMELGEIEAAALKSWERAEKLFAAKDMRGAKAAYETFEREHGQTATAKAGAATVRERYDAIEKVIGPAPTLSLDLGGGVKMGMLLIKAGEFMMGADNEGGNEEKPAHKVKISKPFYMGKFHVTVAQFRAFANAIKFQTEAEKCGRGATWKDGGWKELAGVNWQTPGFPQEDNYPACVITWNDAQEFCKWAAKQTGRNVCLPTEAQWEYACRAGTTTRYNTGDKDSDLEQEGWFNKNSGMHTNACGLKKPNAWGLYDMHGNVWHWCQDYFSDKYYAESPLVDPKGPTNGGDRVLRGGAWVEYPGDCRAVHRGRNSPGHRNTNLGFRLVLDF